MDKTNKEKEIEKTVAAIRLANGIKMLEPWEKKEIEGRDKFRFFCTAHVLCNDFKAMDASSDYDVTYSWNGVPKKGEIKQRRKNSGDYDKWFLEEYKHSKLLKYDGEIDYINLYNDGQVAIFDLREVDGSDVYSINLPKTNDNFNDKRDKGIIYLPIDTARYKTF